MSATAAGQRGFTLIEVVVAFAIFALSASALYEALAGASSRSARAQEQELQWLVAQSVLAKLRAEATPWAAEQSGTSPSGSRWHATVEPFDAGTDPESPWKAFEVAVSVEGPRQSSRAVALHSLELARISQ